MLHQPRFEFRLLCRSGTLFQGTGPDFLLLVQRAIDTRQVFRRSLPYSTVRVQLFYPNGQRVGRPDIRAALAALAKGAHETGRRQIHPGRIQQANQGPTIETGCQEQRATSARVASTSEIQLPNFRYA